MNEIHLGGVDLNLLVVLRDLLRTGSTTATARSLGRTQSAVSHALARLRELFADPLFVRAGGALRPTARAEALTEPLDRLLAGVTGMLTRTPREAFDPSRLERTFTLASTDYAEILLLPHLLPLLRREAPGVDLLTRFLGDEIDRAVSTREVDLGIGTRFRPLAGVLSRPLGHQGMVLVARKKHPLAKRGLSIEAYAALDHVLVAPRGATGGVVDTALATHGLTRRVVLCVPHFSSAVHVVASTDLVVTIPESFARTMAETLPLTVLPVPLALDGFQFTLIFSATARDDPAHAWMREQLTRAGKRAFARKARPRS